MKAREWKIEYESPELPEELLRAGRLDDLLHRASFQNRRHSADMVGVEMGRNDIIECGDIPFIQIGSRFFAAAVVARINEHEMPVRFHKDGIPLPDINDCHLKRGIRSLRKLNGMNLAADKGDDRQNDNDNAVDDVVFGFCLA